MGHTEAIRQTAAQLLSAGQVECVIGYEVGSRGRARPAFIYQAEEVERLQWNKRCTHNLTVYLRERVQRPEARVALVVKGCDSRALNVMLAEGKLRREQVHVIGVVCEGIEEGAGLGQADGSGTLQERCGRCTQPTPLFYDTLIGEATAATETSLEDSELARLQALSPAERAAFWLQQFDRCIRCYACRQACPMCDCPTCLYERDDSLWLGMGTGPRETRAFHLGRAYHLAGRCIGCDECERVCPMNIPISLLNRRLAREMEAMFGHRAGFERQPSPITTSLSGQEVAR